MTKVVIMNEAVVASVISMSGPEHRKLANKVMEEALTRAGLSFDEITYVVATGYGRINVPFADKQITEISCHARAVSHLLSSARTVIDIGGQDCKGIKLKNGRVADFVMNDKCAAGTGRFLEVMAHALEVDLADLSDLDQAAPRRATISSTCTVFAESEVVTHLAAGVPRAEIVAGIHEAIASRVATMLGRIPVEDVVVLTGGVARNAGVARILEERLGHAVFVPERAQLAGAIGAALIGQEHLGAR